MSRPAGCAHQPTVASSGESVLFVCCAAVNEGRVLARGAHACMRLTAALHSCIADRHPPSPSIADPADGSTRQAHTVTVSGSSLGAPPGTALPSSPSCPDATDESEGREGLLASCASLASRLLAAASVPGLLLCRSSWAAVVGLASQRPLHKAASWFVCVCARTHTVAF